MTSNSCQPYLPTDYPPGLLPLLVLEAYRRRVLLFSKGQTYVRPSRHVSTYPTRRQGNSGSTSAIPVTLAAIKDIALQRMTISGDTQLEATAGEPQAAATLWKDQPAIVYVVRRPGCPLCREHGKSRRKDTFTLMHEKRPSSSVLAQKNEWAGVCDES